MLNILVYTRASPVDPGPSVSMGPSKPQLSSVRYLVNIPLLKALMMIELRRRLVLLVQGRLVANFKFRRGWRNVVSR